MSNHCTIRRGVQMPIVELVHPPFAIEDSPRRSLSLVLRLVTSDMLEWAVKFVVPAAHVIPDIASLKRRKWMRLTQMVGLLNIP